MADKIILGFNLVCLAFVLFGIFWGLIRGFKKTLSRGLFLLVISIITLFITIPITKLILNIPVTINTDVYGEVTSKTCTLMEFVSIEIENLLGSDFVTKYPEFASAIATLPLALINAIAYGIIFWILKIILFPINSFFTWLFFRDKKPRETLGFSASNNEYPNSDKSIEPLMNVYTKSQENLNKEGMFIKKEDEISKDSPSARAKDYANFQVATQVAKPETKQEIKKREKAERKKNKPKKHRLLGGLVGAFVGVIVMFNTMVPVYGILNIVSTNKPVKISNISSDEITLSNLSNGITDDVIKGYELSVFGRVSKMFGIEKLGLATFDKVTTTTINNKEIVLRNDINALVDTVQEADNLLGLYNDISSSGITNITQEQLTNLINQLDSVIKKSEQVKCVDAFSYYIIPIAVDYIVKNEIKLTDNANLNQLLVDTLISIAESNEIAIFEELNTIVDTLKYLSDQNVLIRIVKNDYSDLLTLFNELDDDFGEQLSNKLFSLKTVNTTLPNLLNIGLTVLDEMINFGYTNNEATAEEIKVSITHIFDNAIKIAKSLSEKSPIYITDNSLVSIGNLLNTFKESSLFNEETYNNLVDYAVNQVKTLTSSLIPENFKNFFNNHLLRNVCDVTDWKNEMQVIADALTILRDKEYGILGDVVEGEEYRQGYNINITLIEETFINIGKALDKLEQSKLLGNTARLELEENVYDNTTTISLLNSIFNEINTSISSGDNTILRDLNEIISIMSNNLVKSSHTYSEDSTFWQDEMTSISTLILNIYKIANSKNFELTRELGSALDKSIHSTLLGEDTTLQLMNKLVGIVRKQILGEDYQLANDNSLNDNIYTMLTEIESNLLSSELYTTMQNDDEFWAKEIVSIIALKNIADKAESVTTISDASSLANDLDVVYTSRIIPQSTLNNTIAVVLRQLKTTTNTGVEGQINELIENIASDITSKNFFTDKEMENFWQIELEHITSLTDLKLTDSADYSVIDNLTSIGHKLDIVTKGNSNVRGSYFITELRVRELLATAVIELKTTVISSFDTKLQDTLGTILDDISTNIYNSGENVTQITITSFEFELTHLKTLAKLTIPSDLFTYTTDLDTLISNLQNLGGQLDSICYNITTDTSSDTSLIVFDEEKNSKIITRSSISSLVSSSFNMAKNGDTDSLFNNLIEEIKSSITNINNNDQVITWTRELSYVATLIQLNSDKEEGYTLDNASEEVGVYIDLIGFNTLSDGEFADIKYNAEFNIIGSYNYSYTENETTKYYNSVIITRTMLKSSVNNLLDEFKIQTPTTDEDNITNELITNLQNNVNTDNSSNTSNYNSYAIAFNELSTIKKNMKDMSSSVEGKAISEINGTEIDQMLDGFQNKIISGVITTRKIALLIVNKIESTYESISGFDSTEAGIYLAELKTHYNSNISSITAEEYSTDTPTDTYANPFTTLQSKLTA
ncbi:MAG: hypothetical protein ACI4PF_01780 [Christensenellales bacterium]